MRDTSESTASETLHSAPPGPSLWQHTRLFEGLDAATVDAIAGRLSTRSFSAGDVLIEQDRWCGELFILHSGVAQVSVSQRDVAADPLGTVMRDTPLRRLVNGDCFGEMSLITGELPSATVRALTDGDAWTLSQDDFHTLVRDYPALTGNITIILSERLSHTSRQQAQRPPQHITLMLAEASPLWNDLARVLAGLTGSTTLFVNFGPATDQSSRTYHIEDLLSGRLNSTLTPNGGGASGDRDEVIVLQGEETDTANDAGTVANLLGALSRLEDRYSHVLIMMPPGSPHLTASLLAVVTRVVVAGSITAVASVRAIVSALPMPANLPMRPEIGGIITDAPSGMTPTTAVLDRLSEQTGASVKALIPASEARRAAAIASLGRWLAGQRIGIAFGGGGVKGWAHLGVLRVLHRLRVPFDCVTGVSIGAICAGIVARGGTLDEYEHLLHLGATYAFHPRFSRLELLSSRAVARFLRRPDVLGERLIEELATPFAAVAADLFSGSEIVIRRGLAWQAVQASAAIPGLFAPVRIGAYCLVDGTVTNPVPISTAQSLGADKVIAIDISGALSPRQEVTTGGRNTSNVPNMVGSMLRSFEIMGGQIRAHSVEQPSVLIKPRTIGISLRILRRERGLLSPARWRPRRHNHNSTANSRGSNARN